MSVDTENRVNLGNGLDVKTVDKDVRVCCRHRVNQLYSFDK